jgi:hypothetical protein
MSRSRSSARTPRAAKDIFSKYILGGLPLHADDLAEHGGSTEACVAAMIQAAVLRMYSETEENRFLGSPTPMATRRSSTSRTSTPAP